MYCAGWVPKFAQVFLQLLESMLNYSCNIEHASLLEAVSAMSIDWAVTTKNTCKEAYMYVSFRHNPVLSFTLWHEQITDGEQSLYPVKSLRNSMCMRVCVLVGHGWPRSNILQLRFIYRRTLWRHRNGRRSVDSLQVAVGDDNRMWLCLVPVSVHISYNRPLAAYNGKKRYFSSWWLSLQRTVEEVHQTK